jgi:bacillithiol biosynthesis cysteine-adding enzyme BshC
LFGKYGLLILNPDDVQLKKIICNDILDEIKNQDCYKSVNQTNERLISFNIKPQVNPRKINLFYIKNNVRSRIEKENSLYKVLDTNISFTEEEIFKEINSHPERFSPNVLFRTLYQEKILPNLAYVGGGSEIAYWLQLKDFFNIKDLTFPILVVRNSALLVSKKNIEKCKKLDIKVADLFQKNHELTKTYLNKISKLKIDLTELKKTVNDNFLNLYKLSLETDKSFLGALKAQETKQINGIEKLEKKLLKAQKKKHKEKLERLILIKEELFPNGSLQERQVNFSEFYRNYGNEFIDILFDNLNPFDNNFSVISL